MSPEADSTPPWAQGVKPTSYTAGHSRHSIVTHTVIERRTPFEKKRGTGPVGRMATASTTILPLSTRVAAAAAGGQDGTVAEREPWHVLLRAFSVRLVLEVFGGAGAVWGFSEACGLRRDNRDPFWRAAALSVGAVFFARWLFQLADATCFRRRKRRKRQQQGGLGDAPPRPGTPRVWKVDDDDARWTKQEQPPRTATAGMALYRRVTLRRQTYHSFPGGTPSSYGSQVSSFDDYGEDEEEDVLEESA